MIVAIETRKHKETIINFDNGKQLSAELVIGADGRMNSITRQYVNNDNKPIYQGFINWVGIFESNERLFSDLCVSDYWGTGERFGIVPISAKKAYWAGGVLADKIGKKNPDQYKNELNKRFKHWPDPITTIINNSPLSSINKIYVHDHDPIQCWHKNNVLLIGDAAHAPLPTSGQGACQALEDAWHLANCLKESGGDINQALNRFTELRLAKTTGVIMGGRQLAKSIFNNNAIYCQQRNQASKNTDFNSAVIGMAKGWANGLPISY